MLVETRPIIPKKKGELISVDYYGPQPVSTGKVRYILTVIDNFTKYDKLYKLRQATTTATIKRIQLYCEKTGKPVAILSDNGTPVSYTHLSNTVIKGATGNKSKSVTQQVLLTARIGDVEVCSIFVVVPELLKIV